MSAASWTVVFAVEALIRLVPMTECLTQVYSGFGEPLVEAQYHAQERIESIITAAERLATAPLRGESHTIFSSLVFATWLLIVPGLGFVHALSSG